MPFNRMAERRDGRMWNCIWQFRYRDVVVCVYSIDNDILFSFAELDLHTFFCPSSLHCYTIFINDMGKESFCDLIRLTIRFNLLREQKTMHEFCAYRLSIIQITQNARWKFLFFRSHLYRPRDYDFTHLLYYLLEQSICLDTPFERPNCWANF